MWNALLTMTLFLLVAQLTWQSLGDTRNRVFKAVDQWQLIRLQGISEGIEGIPFTHPHHAHWEQWFHKVATQ